MKLAIYTSFAVNYLAKARVLADTVKSVNPDIDVVAIVSDRFPGEIDLTKEPFDKVWTVEEYPNQSLQGWIFRHNIMELSTAVKGWGLERLLAAGYDFVMYLDPDCWVMEDPFKVVALLQDRFSIGIVPHTTRPADTDEEIQIIETSSLRHGIYNLGFLIVRNDPNGRRFAQWWAKRLDRFCVDDFRQGLFTDQRWFDLAVGYFDFIQVLWHRGIDVASWNIGQRSLSRNGVGYLVDDDELIFYHFSGVGPAGVHRWVREKFAPCDPLAAELEFRYEEMINIRGQSDLSKVIPYFDLYSDGSRIPPEHRIAYRSDPSFLNQYLDPYDVSSHPVFRSVAETPSSPVSLSLVRDDLGGGDALARRIFDSAFFARVLTTDRTDSEWCWAQYCQFGWSGSVAPNRFFDVAYYRLFASEEEMNEFPTPLHHYVAKGVASGLSPSWIYDDLYYRTTYPEVVEDIRLGHFICGFEHFVKYGADEGRSGCSFFNERLYRHKNLDVDRAVTAGIFCCGSRHYVLFGSDEGRVLC